MPGLVVQPTVYYIIAVTAVISLFIMILYSQLRKFNPLDEPKGLVLLAIMAYRFVDDMLRQETNEKITEKLGPYIAVTLLYIFLSNISGLFGIEPPTANYSVTLTLAAITVILIEVNAIKFNGVKNYVKSLFEPLAPFVFINVISKFSTLMSLSLRLFGNIVSGSILMTIIYLLFAKVSSVIPFIGAFNFVGVAIAPFLHFYFDLFAGLIQTYIFTTLTVTFIGKELPDK